MVYIVTAWTAAVLIRNIVVDYTVETGWMSIAYGVF